MPESDRQTSSGFHREDGNDGWPGIDSRFRLIVVAAQRSKQLQRGSRPRIAADPNRRRSTSIALEEVKLGLVPFINNTKDEADEAGDGHAEKAMSSSVLP
ncbi:MAG TPA: DNA-directed RNA polymerase subunit omega [Pyrinomonadaceae bacterium]